MKIKLSDFDRYIVGAAHQQVPWQGNEATITSMYELGELLDLKAAVTRWAGKPLEQIPRAPTFAVNLSADQAELLIALAAGGGQAIKGDMGPILGELVVRLRKALPRKAPPAPAAAE